jgi:hypothetical protein
MRISRYRHLLAKMIRTLAKSISVCVIGVLLYCCEGLNAQNIPPRVEIGGILSAGTQSDIGNYFHVGGGGRATLNVTKYLAGEAEATRQPTDRYGPPPEVHTFLAVKGTYRAEQRRWLHFAGLNFFGVGGPAFVNRSVYVPGGGCYKCAVLQRQTVSMLEWGGGFEVVPVRAVAIRFDLTHANFSEQDLFQSGSIKQRRTYLKVAVMLRVPNKGVLVK